MGVRILEDYFERLALGEVTDKTYIYKFGRNAAVGATEVLIASGGIYGLPPTAQTVDIISSVIASDNPTGAGARKVRLFGLDGSYNQISEIVDLGATSVLSYLRIFRAYVESAGTITPVGGANVGIISIDQVASGIPMVLINPNEGQTLTACYTVPSGYKALIWSADTTTGQGKNATSRLKSRDVHVDSPFLTKGIRDNYENSAGQQFLIPSVHLAKADIVFTSISTAVGTPVSGTFLIELVKDDR